MTVLELDTVDARFPARPDRPAERRRGGGGRRRDVQRAARPVAVPPLAARAGDRPAAQGRGEGDRRRRPVHRADQARGGQRADRRGRPRAADRARHHGGRQEGPQQRARRRGAAQGDRRALGQRDPQPGPGRRAAPDPVLLRRAGELRASRPRSWPPAARSTQAPFGGEDAWIDYLGPPGTDPDLLVLARARTAASRPTRSRAAWWSWAPPRRGCRTSTPSRPAATS